jgi:tripartite-type tricarboxylate transporter receptor subunit TctC
MHRRAAVVLLAATALGMHARGASAQAYPARPIRLVVPFPPGGPLGVGYVAKQPADGYTLVIGAVATHAINPWLFAKLPYDPVKDFAPVSLIAHVPNVLVMTPETATRLGVNSLGELVAYMKKQPGRLNYASGGNGSAGHMAGELLKSTAGLFAVHIPYAGAAPAQLGLLAGQTDFMFDNLASAAPQIRAGRLRAFAVTTRTRAASFPDLPTMGEAGGASLKGFDISTWFGVLAPAGTPAPIVDQLSAAMRAALTSAEIRERLARMGAEPAPSTPAGFAALIQSELAKYREIVRFSGAKVD